MRRRLITSLVKKGNFQSKRSLHLTNNNLYISSSILKKHPNTGNIPGIQSIENAYKRSYHTYLYMSLTGISFYSLAIIILNNSIHDRHIDNDSKMELDPVKSKTPITPNELMKHNTPEDCWVVINNQVYDLTTFIQVHPGGPNIIRSNAGKDVTAIFNPLHPPNTIETMLPKQCYVGPLEGGLPKELICNPYTPGESMEDIRRKIILKNHLPPLESIINLYDFEKLASKILSNQAWAYYSSGANDEISYRENHSAYTRIFFKPKVLVDVSKVDLSTEMLGSKIEVPFYATATALCKLGNPEGGEMDIARGCGQGLIKVPQMISTLASCSVEEIVGAAPSKDQIQWYQVYINSDRNVTRHMIKKVEDLGVKALFVTVDAPFMGAREKDLKIKFSNSSQGPKVMTSKAKDDINKSIVNKKEEAAGDVTEGASRTLSKFIDPSLTWKDIIELKKWTKLPIVIKGVQRVEDVVKAAEIGVDGVVLSNHGGRQLDFSRPPVELLAESVPILKEKKLDDKLELYVDGGIRRGTDVLKALCLGAKGVGLGRPFLYANSCYGKDGVQKAIDILKDEIEMSMRLLGVTSIKELNEDLLEISNLKSRSVNVSKDVLFEDLYQNPTYADFSSVEPAE
ncbi:FMN-dependent alpha-hydroxy acid dehydrogenase NDAI_0D04700 [Naumovozyma dairenensis CBS 421]|uniref:L-lactate dehydrogenase (cytochrome) n=1 Tax=Naumovozyma dairenensis (strain ATCC 10597 / BCRC 20456 / CBS 421 / NBRC 0211 / NRRL Y-12639) TaxID=1071378 RepID=G0WAH2_NAUDC|nr:hypothetical protein NDAI_0D04700 [Naumovozyma dairenensis CBS 421]CCD24783.1 hypothetical protein NDAI_0D04700 [Naumovozyma dairenensis CBS 421]